MGTPRLMWLMVSIVLVGMCISVFGLNWANLTNIYGVPTDDIQGNVNSSYNKLSQLSVDVKGLKEDTTNIKTKEGETDILGNLITNGYNNIISSLKSFDVVIQFTEDGINELPMGEAKRSIADGLVTIFLIVIFVGIILAILLKFKT